MPPTIAAAKPLIVKSNSRFGLDVTTSDASAMPPIPAVMDPPTQETMASLRDDTPRRLATSGSVAAARMASPVAVNRKKA